jgi:uncharacterized membrane protein YeaQ/YmgE (transglycosylase-associated protein family)
LGLLIFIVVGAIAGFAASKVVSGKGMGLLWDIVVGIIGAFLGAWLAGLVGIQVDMGSFSINGLLSAFVGAVILLVIFRALAGRGMFRRR